MKQQPEPAENVCTSRPLFEYGFDSHTPGVTPSLTPMPPRSWLLSSESNV